MLKKTVLLILSFISFGTFKAYCQTQVFVDTVLTVKTGAFFKDGADTVSVRFKGNDLKAKLIFSFRYNEHKDSISVKACDFPDSEFYIKTITDCLDYTTKNAKEFGGYFKIEELQNRRYFSGYPKKYAYDDMQDVEIKKNTFATWHLTERLKFDLRKIEPSDSLIKEVILDIYNSRYRRNQITLYGPYEFIVTYAWSNVVNKAVQIDSPYGL